MKNLLIVLLCLFIAAVASADVKIVQKVKSGPIMGQQPKDSTISMSVKGKKARVDTARKRTSRLSIWRPVRSISWRHRRRKSV